MNYYKDLLSLWIQKSELTLRQIAQKCEEKNHAIDPSYISKLQTGKLPPPSEAVSRALAEVLGANPDEFIFLGYITKTPSIIRLPQNLEVNELSEIFSCINRLLELSPKFRQKAMNEIEWLRKFDDTSNDGEIK